MIRALWLSQLLLCTGIVNGLLCSPIGHIETCWDEKFGSPRQGALVPDAKARLRIKVDGIDAHQALEGITAYSHVWLFWSFHLNKRSYKSKVQAPMLRGGRTGLFSTRSPFRPNPIGLTLAVLEGIEGDTLLLSGVDCVNGTPILDVKPYLPQYDAPRDYFGDRSMEANSKAVGQTAGTDTAADAYGVSEMGVVASGAAVRVAEWVGAPPLEVVLSTDVEQAISEGIVKPRLLTGPEGLRRTLAQALAADPRPLYRWKREVEAGGGHGQGAEYEVRIDGCVAVCRFQENLVTVISLS